MNSLSKPQALRVLTAALALALALTAAPTWGRSDVRIANGVAAPALQTSLPTLSDLPAPTLPGMALAQSLERDAPRVQAGQSALDAARRQGEALRAGPQEFTGRVQMQSRRIDSGPDAGRYTEWQLLLERPLRWPAQARADDLVASATERLAAVSAEDARHETHRLLLQQWFDAQRSAALAQLGSQSAGLVRAQRDALARREQLGDASRLELEQMQAEFAREQAQALLAQGQAEAARQALLARFPSAAVAFTMAMRQPVDATAAPATSGAAAPEHSSSASGTNPPAFNPAPVRLQESDPLAFEAAYLRNSHELGMARSEWQRTQALAEKAAAARTPEPTVGLYAGSERGGNERIVGLQLSMPFGGTARSAQHEALLAEAQAAEWHLRDVESRLRAEFRSQWAQAQALSAGAQALDSASRAQNLSAARMQRAYALGEASLADGLNTRRVALQTLRDALTARFDAAYAAARLRLDAHALWAGGGMNAEHAH